MKTMLRALFTLMVRARAPGRVTTGVANERSGAQYSHGVARPAREYAPAGGGIPVAAHAFSLRGQRWAERGPRSSRRP